MFLAWTTTKNGLCDFERDTIHELVEAIVHHYFHFNLGEPEVKLLMSTFDDREVEHETTPINKAIALSWVQICVDNGMSPNHHMESIQREEYLEAKARGEF